MFRPTLFLIAIAACGKGGEEGKLGSAVAAATELACGDLVPQSARDQFLAGYTMKQNHVPGLAAKCLFNAEKGMVIVEAECRNYSDDDIARQKATIKKIADDFVDMTPPIGRASWTRKAGNQVVFWDPETGCKVNVTWDAGKPTADLARAIEATLL